MFIKIIENYKYRKILLASTYVLGFLFIIVRSRFGYCFWDEPLALTMAQRIDMGDALIAHEWHGIQNVGVVLLPFYKLFHLLSGGSNDGIFLFLRHVYCIIWQSVCMYASLFMGRRYKSVICEIIVYVYLILFSPIDYMMLSYHSIGLMCVILLCCLIIEIYDGRIKSQFLAALLLSVVISVFVLCLPFAVIIYFLLFFVCILAPVKLKNEQTVRFRRIILLTVPILFVFVALYLWVFVLSRAEIGMVLKGLPYIFKDPQHNPRNPLFEIYRLARHIFRQTKFYCIACIIGCIAAFFAKKFPSLKKWTILICSCMFIIYQVILTRYVKYGLLNYQMLYINLIGIVAFLFLNKKPKLEFTVFLLIGIVYTYLAFLASNVELITISMASSVFGCFACVLIALLLKENLTDRHIYIVLCAVLCIQILSESATRMFRQYWDNWLPYLTHKIEVGACKGLYTSEENKKLYDEKYDTLMHLLDEADISSQKKLLILTYDPVVYIDANLPYATFSSCIDGYGDRLYERIAEYQYVTKIIPDVIYCESKDDIITEIVDGYTEYEYNGSYLFVK